MFAPDCRSILRRIHVSGYGLLFTRSPYGKIAGMRVPFSSTEVEASHLGSGAVPVFRSAEPLLPAGRFAAIQLIRGRWRSRCRTEPRPIRRADRAIPLEEAIEILNKGEYGTFRPYQRMDSLTVCPSATATSTMLSTFTVPWKDISWKISQQTTASHFVWSDKRKYCPIGLPPVTKAPLPSAKQSRWMEMRSYEGSPSWLRNIRPTTSKKADSISKPPRRELACTR
jgi:hypothetical protein